LVKPCDQHIQRTIQLTQDMISLADEGDADREDSGCGVLYGVLRDAAYKLWRLAEEEKKRHQAKGWWEGHSPESDSIQENLSRPEAQTSREKKEEKS